MAHGGDARLSAVAACRGHSEFPEDFEKAGSCCTSRSCAMMQRSSTQQIDTKSSTQQIDTKLEPTSLQTYFLTNPKRCESERQSSPSELMSVVASGARAPLATLQRTSQRSGTLGDGMGLGLWNVLNPRTQASAEEGSSMCLDRSGGLGGLNLSRGLGEQRTLTCCNKGQISSSYEAPTSPG